jgi:hypothetical protein
MLAAFVAGLLPFAIAMPWDRPSPPPEKTELVLTHPQPPDPPPAGSVMDVPVERELPENWRSTASASTKAKENAGLGDLMASGSGQFCREQLYAMRTALKGKSVVVVDLRQEPHALIDGAAISWGPPVIVGADRSAPELERVERAWLQHLVAGKFTTITEYASGAFADTKTWLPIALKLDIREAATEGRLIAEAHWGYFRIAAPDTIVPRDQDIDRFVALVRDLDEGLWMHFHCDTGGNRTTMFLTLYDMMRNYVRAPRPDIISRQQKLGGFDLLAGSHKAERKEFLDRFFNYCWQCGPLFRKSWSSWNRRQLRGGD